MTKLRQWLVNIISVVAYHLRFWQFLYKLTPLRKSKKLLAVFTFHRVTDLKVQKKYYKDYERGEDVRVFEEQIKAIGSYFRIIGLDEFMDILDGKKELKTHAALLTFDDADSDFIKYAFPILSKYGYDSVNFAPTNYIDTEKRFWHLRLSNLIYNANPETLIKILESADHIPENLKALIRSLPTVTEFQLPEVCRKIAMAFHEMDEDTFDTILDQWDQLTSVSYVLDIKCMGWDDLRSLESNLVEIESHTASHRILNRLNSENIKKELDESKNRLDAELNKKVRTLCYPMGAFNDDVLREMVQSGNDAGFTTAPGLCAYPAVGDERYKIKRFGIYGDNKYRIHLFLGRIAARRVFLGK